VLSACILIVPNKARVRNKPMPRRRPIFRRPQILAFVRLKIAQRLIFFINLPAGSLIVRSTSRYTSSSGTTGAELLVQTFMAISLHCHWLSAEHSAYNLQI
jgi:hypothetical protein